MSYKSGNVSAVCQVSRFFMPFLIGLGCVTLCYAIARVLLKV